MCLASLSEISLKVMFRACTFNRASSEQVTCTGRLTCFYTSVIKAPLAATRAPLRTASICPSVAKIRTQKRDFLKK